jgi:hypothetical protein
MFDNPDGYDTNARSPERVAVDEALDTDPGLEMFVMVCAFDDDLIREWRRLYGPFADGQTATDEFVVFCADLYSAPRGRQARRTGAHGPLMNIAPLVVPTMAG